MGYDLNLINGIQITPLKQIYHPQGDIYHVLKCSENSFKEFGEAYFTTIHHRSVKGWKKHTKMWMNIVVPVGLVRFHFYDEETSQGCFINVGKDNYFRITIQPGVWVAFQGLADGLNLILNVANIAHDPNESINVDLSSFPLNTNLDAQ